ncbi:outer membrane protein assembly factor [Hyphomicrobium methylovorum]|nr:outer membrane protein assembly factor [Hyphomicrobium methylovorum]
MLAIAIASIAKAGPADALELFGVHIFGETSSVAAGDLAYHTSLNISGTEDSSSLEKLISDVSHTMQEQEHGAQDAYTLVARTRGDVDQIRAALYSDGYYAGDIDIRIAGQKLEGLDPATLSTAKDARIEVAFNIATGPRFAFGNVQLTQRSHPNEAPSITAEDLGLVRGAPAKSSIIIAATDKLVESWRVAGFPLARVVDKDISADHAQHAVDVHVEIDPGPPAVYGWVGVSGAPTLNHDTVMDQSKLEPGQRFSPADLKRARDRLAKMPSVESVRVVEGNAVDPNGGIPVSLEVVERKPRYFGATASLSSTDGAEIEAHWGHRNFFGEGEHLRLEGGLSRIGDNISQLEFDAAAIYTKPGVLDVDTDLISEFRLAREHPDTYESLDASAKVGLAHVFSPALSGSVSLATKFSRVDDAFGQNDYLLISLPIEAAYDTRDKPLDATTGVSILAAVTPTAEAIRGVVFNKSEVQAATYQALDADGHAVLAGRIGAGSIAGAALSEVPASTRFFAGGGGSVRGYDYRSLGPMLDGNVIGGLGYVSASAELRLRVTEQFGIVPFIDAASVTDNPWPSFSDIFIGAGLGLRYYTAIGPLRIDVATPLTDRDEHSSVAVYIGLGQAF